MSGTGSRSRKHSTEANRTHHRTARQPSSDGRRQEPINTYYTVGMRYIHDNIIGNHAMVSGPFGPKRMTYADYTASGRNLYMIENYLAKYVLSYYGNTHTSTSFVSAQTTKFREEAKNLIRRAVNASSDDVVIFCGSGATSCIHKLIFVLGLDRLDEAKRAVVFIGPYEHHSNILPWKETGAKIVRINENQSGQLDMNHMKSQLAAHNGEEYSVKVATFSACSNVTGLITDTIKVTQLLHEYNTLALWDYAAGAPYLKMDMNPVTTSKHGPEMAFKDALFCSPHKFIGGPGSPGLLVAKKKLFTNAVPHGSGGGTVLLVTNHMHSYIPCIEEREEGGTPGIIEAIRAGLVFQLKHSVGLSNIHSREQYLVDIGIKALTGNPNIILLGSKTSPRIPIFSIAIRHPESKKLVHHNFVALLLNDLFGIQSRGGCACAGPYAQDLLGIAEEVSAALVWLLDLNVRHNLAKDEEVKVAQSIGVMKPGFVRINLSYFMTDDEVDFILSGINIVANVGWRIIPQYTCNIETGNWSHRAHLPHFKLMSLYDIDYRMEEPNVGMNLSGVLNPKAQKLPRYGDIVRIARNILERADIENEEFYSPNELTMKDVLPESLYKYIWWIEPHYAKALVKSQSSVSLDKVRKESIPIKPRTESGPSPKNSEEAGETNHPPLVFTASAPAAATNDKTSNSSITKDDQAIRSDKHSDITGWFVSSA